MQRSILDLITAESAGDPLTQSEIDRLKRLRKALRVRFLAAVNKLYPKVFENLRDVAPKIFEAASGAESYQYAQEWAIRNHLACEDEEVELLGRSGAPLVGRPWWTAVWAVEAARDLVRHPQRPWPDLDRKWLYPQPDGEGGLISFGDPTPRRKHADHFLWTARHLVGGENFHAIARSIPKRRRTAVDPNRPDADWTTVRDAVRELATRLHLKLPPSARGGRTSKNN